jgi:hypothetical protein
MFGFAFQRARAGLGTAAAVIGLGVLVPAAMGDVKSSSGRAKLAARLMRLDPGAQVGGNTQVATAAGARLLGVPRRTNYMMGLGRRSVIVGGAGHDELGVLGDAGRIYGGGGPDLIHGGPGNDRLYGGAGNDLIYGGGGGDRLYGGPGNDAIYGGPGNDVIDGGPGNDQIIDKQGATTVFAGPGTNRVDVADGRGDDRVVCGPGSINHIRADRGDRTAPSCGGKGSSVRYVRLLGGDPAAHAAQTSGTGSNTDPYSAECDPVEPIDVDCETSEVWSESLTGLWTHAYVPAVQCPASHPWLTNTNYVPWGTVVPNGIEIAGLGPIGVSISGDNRDSNDYTIGTLTGGDYSSVTNWTGGTNTYTIYLHCTHNIDNRYH